MTPVGGGMKSTWIAMGILTAGCGLVTPIEISVRSRMAAKPAPIPGETGLANLAKKVCARSSSCKNLQAFQVLQSPSGLSAEASFLLRSLLEAALTSKSQAEVDTLLKGVLGVLVAAQSGEAAASNRIEKAASMVVSANGALETILLVASVFSAGDALTDAQVRSAWTACMDSVLALPDGPGRTALIAVVSALTVRQELDGLRQLAQRVAALPTNDAELFSEALAIACANPSGLLDFGQFLSLFGGLSAADRSSARNRLLSRAIVPRTPPSGGWAGLVEWKVGGEISGLSGTLVLRRSGSQTTTITSNGSILLPWGFPHGSAVAITIASQPESQLCALHGGTVVSITSHSGALEVTCSTRRYAVGGTVSGLSGTLVLENTLGDVWSVTSNGAFAFPNTVAHGSSFGVSVRTQPAGQTCAVSQGSSLAVTSTVSSIAIECETTQLAPEATVLTWAQPIGGGKIRLTFDELAGSTGYRVFYGTSPGVSSASSFVEVDESPAVFDGGGNPDAWHWFRVAARNEAGVGPLSNEMSARSMSFVSLYKDYEGFSGLPSSVLNHILTTPQKWYLSSMEGFAISSDGGQTWLNRTTSHGLVGHSARQFVKVGDRILLMTTRGLAVSDDDGLTWTGVSMTSHGLLSNDLRVAAADGAFVAVGGSATGLAVSDDGGITWQSFVAGAGSIPQNTVSGIALSATRLYAATSSGVAVMAREGRSWSTRAITAAGGFTNGAVFRVAMCEGRLMIGHVSQGFGYSDDDGLTWTRVTLGLPTQVVSAIHCLGNGKVVVGTSNGMAFSHDLGTSFTARSAGSGEAFPANARVEGFGVSGGRLLALTQMGYAHTDDLVGFTNWTTVRNETIPYNNLTRRLVASAGKMAAATAGGVSISWDGGRTWRTDITPKIGNMWAHSAAIADGLLAVATEGGLALSEDDGESYIMRTLAAGNLGHNKVYGVALFAGKIYAATENGLSIANDNPADRSAIVFQAAIRTPQLPNAFTKDVVVVPNPAPATDVTLVVGTNGGLGISMDGGASWSSRTVASHGLAGNTVNRVFYRNDKIYVATTSGISICDLPCTTFINITTGLASNDVRDLAWVGESETHFFAATAGGVSETRDGGQTWVSFQETHGLGDRSTTTVIALEGRIVVGTDGGVAVMLVEEDPAN